MMGFVGYYNAFVESLNNGNWITHLIILLLVTLLLLGVWRFIVKRAQAAVDSSENVIDDILWFAFWRPINWFIILSSASIALSITSNNKHFELPAHLYDIQKASVIFLVGWVFWRFIHKAQEVYSQLGRKDITSVQALGKLGKLMVAILVALTMVQSFGISLSGLLAFGGMGGLVVGMAAKDMLGNFFGALMIYLDKPFKIGDWIRSPDREIEGTVEKIGWRLTIIRTFDQRPRYVPNGLFTQMVVENATRMHNRRINETFGLRYKDIHKIHDIIRDTREMLKNHPGIEQDQTLIVNFTMFNNSSLDFFIYTFTKTTNWIEFHEVKQNVLLAVAEIVISHDAEFAFPTRQLHLSKESLQSSGLENKDIL